MNAPRSIVIVKLSAIGDVIHGIPTAVALKQSFPDSTISWVVEGRSADVLAGHNAVDHLFRLPRGWLKSFKQVLHLRQQLRRFQADAVIDLQGLLKSSVVTFLSGSRLRIGHAKPESREGAWLTYTDPIVSGSEHVVERNLDLLRPLGIKKNSFGFDMPTWPVSQQRVEKWLSQLQFQAQPIIINPGAGWISKRWPPDRFATFAKAVWQKHRVESLVVWGGSSEEKIAKEIVEKAGQGTTLAPATTLQDLGELCRKARLFISGDTGPLHLAAAVGTPCVGLFGPVPAARNGPYGNKHIIIEPPPAVRPHWKDRKTDTESMAAITVEQVLAAVESGLRRTNAA